MFNPNFTHICLYKCIYIAQDIVQTDQVFSNILDEQEHKREYLSKRNPDVHTLTIFGVNSQRVIEFPSHVCAMRSDVFLFIATAVNMWTFTNFLSNIRF